MGVKRIMKRCIWFALVILMSCLLILEGKAVADTILAHPDLTVRDYDRLDWALQKMTVFYLPLWCLALLGLLRSFLGENWFPFAERIPMSVTKAVMAASEILWVGAAVFSAVYLRQIQKSYDLYFRMESVFSRWRTVFPVLSSDLPERIQAAVSLHLFYVMVGGLAFLCTTCLLIKQIRSGCRSHHSS